VIVSTETCVMKSFVIYTWHRFNSFIFIFHLSLLGCLISGDHNKAAIVRTRIFTRSMSRVAMQAGEERGDDDNESFVFT